MVNVPHKVIYTIDIHTHELLSDGSINPQVVIAETFTLSLDSSSLDEALEKIRNKNEKIKGVLRD